MVLNNLDLRYRPTAKLEAEKHAGSMRLKEVSLASVFECKLDLMRMYLSPVTFTYEGHDGPVTGVSCNPFNRSLFASCSSDGTCRVYHYLESKPILELEPILNKRLTCLSWSLTRALVLAVGCDNGKLYIFDFLQNQNSPVTQIVTKEKVVMQVAFNGIIKDLVALCYQSGNVEVVQLSPVFSTPHPDEQRRLQILIKQVND